MSQIIGDIRALMTQTNLQQMNINEILKRLQKLNPNRYDNKVGFTKDNLIETVNHYKKLSVVYVDNEGNVIFL